jgi:glycosyltransferase involved in cell wall biosynthesis
VIRVLELLTGTELGGGPRQVYHLLRHLPRSEFSVSVAGPYNRRFLDEVQRLEVEATTLPLDTLSALPRTLLATRRLIRASRADVVHTHGKGAGFYGRLAARLAGVPAVHTFHGIHYEGYSRAGRLAYLALERGLSRITHTLINVSAAQEAEATALGLARRGSSAVVVNGIDVEALAALPREGRPVDVPERALVLGCVARFDPIKRHDVLIRAFGLVASRRRHEVALLLVGDGPENDRLRRLVREVAPPLSVVFLDAIGLRTNPYSAMDLYVTASAKEGLPLAPLEAMASELAVIATDVPGHREVVRHGETGLLVPAGDAKAFAAAIETLLDDPERRRRMGRAGRERVMREFTVQPMVAKTAAIYRAAAATR